MKANFKLSKNNDLKADNIVPPIKTTDHDFDDKEFEEFLVKNGAAGSFMVFRDGKEKTKEMGIDEL